MSGSQGGATPVPSVNPLAPWTPAQLQALGQARAQLKATGRKMRQPVASGSFVPTLGNATTWQVTPQPVGLITSFTLEIDTTITQPAGGSTITLRAWGPASMLSNIQYTNPSQFSPINTPGWHVAATKMGRMKQPPGAAFTTDSPLGVGAILNAGNIAPIQATSTIAASATGYSRMEYEIPLAYAPELGNYQGAVFGGSTMATQTLQFTFNPNFIVTTATTDTYNVGYNGANTTPANYPTMATTWTLYQHYLDQFDLSLLNPLTPDLSTSYYLTTVPQTGLVAATDNYVPFQNLRTYMSAMFGYDNGGTWNAGTDINNFKLISANQLPFWNRSLQSQAYLTRNLVKMDYPAGYYYFDFRDAPIATQAEGNTTLTMNPITVGGSSVLYTGFEYLAVQAILAGAPSIT